MYLGAIDIYCIPRIGLPILLQPNRQIDPGNIFMYIAHRYMNIGIGTRPLSFITGNTLLGFLVQCGIKYGTD